MQTLNKRIGKITLITALLIALLSISFTANAYIYNRASARNTINKTSYIIDEALYISNYYNFWTTGYLSRAVYYNDFAQRLYNSRQYRYSIYYSLKARQYALMVIDRCDDYWFGFFYNNPHYNGGYYGNNNYPNHNNSNNHYANSPSRDRNNDAFEANKGNNSSQTGHLTGNETSPRENSLQEYKNIKMDNYFDESELALFQAMPTEESMEENFEKSNRGVVFSDNTIKNNTTLINSNKTRAQEFQKDTPAKKLETIKMQEPKKIDANIKTNTNKTNNTTIDNNRKISSPTTKTPQTKTPIREKTPTITNNQKTNNTIKNTNPIKQTTNNRTTNINNTREKTTPQTKSSTKVSTKQPTSTTKTIEKTKTTNTTTKRTR
ncbi:MAG: hypothetical protein LBM25_06080 [Bacteroidales bacterium]|jgi:hypothetical protein|nr:hypothetical protein [Bacteroidales bacterium]